MKMKKIVLAVFSLQGNGAERVVQTLARNLNAAGHEAHIVLFKDVIDLPLDPGVKIHNFPYKYYRMIPKRWRASIGAKAFDRFVKTRIGTPDIVLSNLLPVDFILSRSRLNNIHHVIHNTVSQEFGTTNPDNEKLTQFLEIYSGKNCICVSKGVEQDLNTLFPNQITTRTIYNPVDLAHVRSAAGTTSPSKNDYIIHIGKFKKAKRHDRLLRAFAKSDTRHKLILLGSGPLLEETKKLADDLGIADRVEFAGFQKNPFSLLKGAQIMVVSSDFEGLPMNILEAVTLGVPVISTNCPSGPSEILPPLNLVEVDDIAALAVKISHAAKHPDKYKIELPSKFHADVVARQYATLSS